MGHKKRKPEQKDNSATNSTNNSPKFNSSTTKMSLQSKSSQSIVLCIESLSTQVKIFLQNAQNLDPAIGLLMQQMLTIQESCKCTLESQMTVQEAVEEKERSRSVVIANLDEPEAANATGRVKEDFKSVCEMLDAAAIEVLPVSVYRMGVKNEGRKRLLKVVFPNSFAAREFQKKRGIISSQTNFKVFIRESLSKEQLMMRATLLQQRNEKNKSLDGDELFVLWGPPGQWELIKKKDIGKKR